MNNKCDNWKHEKISQILKIHDSKRIPLSSKQRSKMEKIYPYYGAASILDYVDDYIFDGTYLLVGEDGTVIDNNGYPILQYVFGKFWVNNHAHVITGKNGFSVEILYLLLKNTNINGAITGAVQLKLNQQNLKNLIVTIPDEKFLIKFDNIIKPLFSQIKTLKLEIQVLKEIKNILLPKLLSGELDIEKIKL